MPAAALQTLFALLSFSVAVLSGMEFAVASSIIEGTATSSGRGVTTTSSGGGGATTSPDRAVAAASTASYLYGLDLAGSALGALVISVYAIPMFGVVDVSKLLGWTSAAAAAFCMVAWSRKRT
jgi:hypothetical protein